MALPSISQVVPTTGPTTGGTAVTIVGANLLNPTAVTFGGTNAMVTSSTSTTISVTSPAKSVGAAQIIVTTGAGSSTQPVFFNYVVATAPVITSLNPISGPVSGSNVIYISGSGLSFVDGVGFGITNAQSFAVLSDTKIAAVAPAVGLLPYTYTTLNAPTTTAVSPSTGAAAGGNSVTIAGSGFTYATSVAFGANTASFTVLSDTTINAVVPAGPPAGGNVTIIVSGPGGSSPSGPSYTYAAAPTPTITSLTPSSGPLVGGGTITIQGTNLNAAIAILFGAIPALFFTVLSPTAINVTVPPGLATGAIPVTVTTLSGTSSSFPYTYLTPPSPTTIFPTAGVITGGTAVTITGIGLTGTSSVLFGSTPSQGTITVSGDTLVTVTAPPHPVGTVPVTITTPGGTDSSLSFSFQPTAAVTSISPALGPLDGGNLISITGAGLFGANAVLFGSVPATTVLVISDNLVTAVAPAEAVGAVSVTVSTAASVSNGVLYQYIPPPTLTAISPTTGSISGGGNVTLMGTGFLTATTVFFGLLPATFTVLNDTTITATVPITGLPGPASVTVTNPGGTSGAQTYTYHL
ncbi:hypothetical protein N7509_004195 [Penicillium cosmopolitanum]|uniref:IPT/TIG domain-containing protein n=1 Tax=Penicillium cosmopolitanum TaxID=1131564 RepID=A0A9X0BC68_9EURO|nr:uncharacterized protein N7509_004195 [Penicillium cosmopolitanum]KAJ5404324.1 hypothetical protein N7509_004195 [Penicillium cosmopolitanum]